MNILYNFRRLHAFFLFHYWYPQNKENLEKNPKKLADFLYYLNFKRHINWAAPRDLNEIINFLAFNTDTTLWTRCADKYAVREYVKEKGLSNILIPLYGKWDKAEDMNFENLPSKFVVKTNNGYGDAFIVNDKSTIDINKIKKRMSEALNLKFGIESAEAHYTKIKPCIIAEKLLETKNETGLVDYEVWCFHGKPYYIFTCSNRDLNTHHADFNLYDLQWNCIDDKAIVKSIRNSIRLPRPKNLTEMLYYASILSKDFVQARIDFYNIDGCIYFGEITLTSQAGRMNYFTDSFLEEMGEKIRAKWNFK